MKKIRFFAVLVILVLLILKNVLGDGAEAIKASNEMGGVLSSSLSVSSMAEKQTPLETAVPTRIPFATPTPTPTPTPHHINNCQIDYYLDGAYEYGQNQITYRGKKYDGIEFDGKTHTYTCRVYVDQARTKELQENKDYTVRTKGNMCSGVYALEIYGIGQYGGTVKKDFLVNPPKISDCDIEIHDEDLVYNGSEQLPRIEISKNGINFKEIGAFYLRSNEAGKDAGTHSLYIYSPYVMGNTEYSSYPQLGFEAYEYHIVSYNIKKRDISKCEIKKIEDQTYTGTQIEPKPFVYLDGERLTQGTDYTFEYKNNIEEGTATITVLGVKNGYGTAESTFQITKPVIEEKTEPKQETATSEPETESNRNQKTESFDGNGRIEVGTEEASGPEKKKKTDRFLKKPTFSLKKGKTSKGYRCVIIRLNKYEGTNIEIYLWKGKKKTKIKLSSSNIRKNKKLFKLTYTKRNTKYNFSVATYKIKKGKKVRSRESNVKKIRV